MTSPGPPVSDVGLKAPLPRLLEDHLEKLDRACSGASSGRGNQATCSCTQHAGQFKTAGSGDVAGNFNQLVRHASNRGKSHAPANAGPRPRGDGNEFSYQDFHDNQNVGELHRETSYYRELRRRFGHRNSHNNPVK